MWKPPSRLKCPFKGSGLNRDLSPGREKLLERPPPAIPFSRTIARTLHSGSCLLRLEKDHLFSAV
jgi:hypothetical protein